MAKIKTGITLFSLGTPYLKGELDLEGVIRTAAEMGAVGYVANAEQTAAALSGINMTVNLIFGIMYLLCLIPLYFYPLNEERAVEILASLEAKKATQTDSEV